MDTAEPQVEGKLVRDMVFVSDNGMRHDLELRGYGEESKDGFFLKPFESLYLLYYDRLRLRKAKKYVDFDSFMRLARKSDDQILAKFLIYRDLRTRGYVVKDGFGFGSDFRVYEKGRFGDKGAKYVVFGISEGTQAKIWALEKKIRQITQMGKEPIAAVIERRGEIIYYRISKIDFPENKGPSQVKLDL